MIVSLPLWFSWRKLLMNMKNSIIKHMHNFWKETYLLWIFRLFSTFITTPSIKWIYPPTSYKNTNKFHASDAQLNSLESSLESLDIPLKSDAFRPLLCVAGLASAPTMINLLHHLQSPQVHPRLVRILEASDRSSSIIKEAHKQQVLEQDLLLKLFKTFTQ